MTGYVSISVGSFVRILLFIALVSIAALPVRASSDGASFEIKTEKQPLIVRELVSGLHHPWSIAFISETDWLITERSGTLRRVVNGQLLEKPIAGLPPIAAKGQGGLLDVALHPNFSENQLVYLSYVGAEKGRYGTEVLVATLIENQLEDVRVIFKAVPKMKGGRHFGSRLAFDRRGYLFISLGDRGQKESAQRLDQHPGSIIRLHADGSIPANNPFVHHVNALPEIYSYGHRNVQGLVYSYANDTLWAHEHGPQGGDELNDVLAGQNYGWPTITYGVNYGLGTQIGIGTEKAGMLQPATYWDPSIAPSGLAVVNSERYPGWQGNLLVGALKFQLVARLELEHTVVKHEERLLARRLGRIRDIKESPDGMIYLLTDSRDGRVYRLE